jgi:pimeloyl-ACP methyl ester carboxylesterase
MRFLLWILVAGLWLSLLTLTTMPSARAESQPGVEGRFADVNGIRLHYRIAGQGEPVILIHGYTQTSRMWMPLVSELVKTHTVLAPDLRGAGASASRPRGMTRRRWRRTFTRWPPRSATRACRS